MTAKTKLSTRMTGLVLCLALVISLLPLSLLTASAATAGIVSHTADTSTMDDWKEYFPITGNIHTENAGGIWTDKSVLTDDSAFSDVTLDGEDNFLVALSAMGSNMTITGHSHVPTDTILVLDVSGSMSGNASRLVDAANSSLKALLEANQYNRVGVVLYSSTGSNVDITNANAARLLLPLGRYTSTATNGNLLQLDGSTVRLLTQVRIEGTTDRPESTSKSVSGGTYIQSGINLARKQFVDLANTTVVEDPIKGKIKRTPVMVLMSDGAPTFGSTTFTDPNTTNLGDGGGSSEALGFVTQLTMSYTKAQLEEKYDTKALVYTLGLGLTSSTSGYRVAQMVLDPSGEYNNTTATAIRNLWRLYNETPVNDPVTVSGSGNSARRVIKIQTALQQNYVTRYYSASSANDMIAAFDAIVADIQLQTKYFPTLTESDENLSGYVTFVDKIGKYMEVKDVKGIRIHQTLFSGKDLSRNFVAGGGELGTFDSPKPLGKEMTQAVMARLGISEEVASTLIGMAYDHGQLAYDASTEEFSNYIGWYADQTGAFLGFWHENIDPATAPENAVYIMKSYGYLGEVDEEHGVVASDMMYADVQVQKSIADGEQTVTFAIPAALIPTVTYEVSLNEDETLKDLQVSGATAPIRLVYEVGLRSDINAFNLTDKVDAAYLNANKNSDGTVNFYTNQYEVSGATGFNPVTGRLTDNAYAYFRPSRQNDRYYYQEESLVYTDDAGTEYHGETKPTENMYHAYTVYYKNGTPKTETVYHKLTAENLDTVQRTQGEDTWYVPAGNVRRDYAGYIQEKTPENITGTLPFVAAPFTDIEGHNVNDTDHSFVVGASLGNNGKLTVKPQTGIAITKTLATDTPDKGDTFTFTVSGASYGTYGAQKILADGSVDPNFTEVSFNLNGEATVELKAGETLYIGDMTPGREITVTETETDTHKVQTVNGGTGNSVTLTMVANTLQAADFVNMERGQGNLTVAKEVEHPFGETYQIPSNISFQITVTLTLDGRPLANRSYNNGTYQTNEDGQFSFSLKDGQQITVNGLPGGTEATVRESVAQDSGFTPEYWDIGVKGDGVITVEAGKTLSVIVLNKYTPKEVFPVNIRLSGTKTLVGRDAWIDADVYEFALEEYDFATKTWTQLGDTKTVKKDTEGKLFTFNEVFADTNFKFETAGTYHYRVREKDGNVPGVSYDTALHSFTVTVGDKDMDGQLEIQSITPTEESNTQVTFDQNVYNVVTDFTNTYQTNATEATVSITKKVVNDSGSHLGTAAGFTFEIVNYNPQTQTAGTVVATSQATSLTGTARVALPFTADGTYYYAVREVLKDSQVWSYDDTLIPITVSVTDDGAGNLVAVAYTESAVNATNTVEVTFTNTYTPKQAELPLDFVFKTYEGRKLNGGEFTFRVSGVNFTAEIDGTNDDKGNVIFQSPLTFTKVGTYFAEIKETSADGNGITTDKNVYRVTITVSDNNGQLEAVYEIVNIQDNTVTFVNKYTADPVLYSIKGTKNLTGRTLLNNEFTFVLTEATDAEGTVLPGAKTYTAENAADKSFSFPSITYTKAGSYYYTVHEKPATGSTYGIEYDTTVFAVTVTVKDNGLGKLYVDEVTTRSGDPILFTNNYVPAPTSTVLPGNKVLKGRVLNADEFSFTLYNSNAAWEELEERETKKNTSDGTFTFSSIDYTTAGTRYYLVKENQGNLGGVTYDPTVFRVKVTVTDNLLGNLKATVDLFDQDNNPRGEIEFVNQYTVSGTDTVTLSGRKTLNGRGLKDGEFTFALYPASSSFVPETDPVKTAVNDGNLYSVSVEYGPEDIGTTFYYVLKEEKSGTVDKGVSYSNAQYNVTVLVKDGGDGTVKTEVSVSGATGPVASTALDFTNTYTAAPTSVTLNGTKNLTGNRTLAAGEFTFDLYEGTGNFNYSGSPLKSVQNKADKSFSFADIPLTEAKTYYFIVKENSESPLPGITYDGTVYQVKVEVTDDGLGNLHAATPVFETAEGVQPALVFNNSYKAKSVPVTVTATKKLTGRTLEAGEFTFILVESNDDFVPNAQATPKKALNKADESVTFDAITFDAAGTYYYVLYEDNSTPLERVSYDPKVFHIIITVTDNTGTGELEYTVQEQNEEDLIFRNTYTPRPTDITVEIGVDKKVNNTGSGSIGPEGFSFRLVKTGDTGTPETVITDKDGKAKFVLTFTEDDIGKTYTYTVTEVNGGREFVTYSTESYTFTVTVALGDNNTLVATVKQGETPVDKAVASFTNTYHQINPPTSDNQITLWFALLFVSTGGLVAGYFCSKRKEQED